MKYEPRWEDHEWKKRQKEAYEMYWNVIYQILILSVANFTPNVQNKI